ncbi:hypothetical protein [Oceanobacillus arenosus]|uniref:hypothetical protein n=1 Tax=Oceanobacillus arenosus TaxID=1229153 RepID=UPI001FE9C3B9|nr:hypothetical protein [Oceanobacillus arenosus]
MMTSDLEQISGKTEFLMIASLIIAIVFVLSIILSLVSMTISAIKNRKRDISHHPINRWYLLLNIAGLAVIANIIGLAIRTLNYASYASVKIQIWINIAYVLVVFVSVVGVIFKWKKSSLSRFQKIAYILSSVVGMLFVLLIICWEFYK